jgi:hypothetical protein
MEFAGNPMTGWKPVLRMNGILNHTGKERKVSFREKTDRVNERAADDPRNRCYPPRIREA